MVRLQITTLIAAPTQRCFELSLNVDLERGSVEGLVAIAGITHGQIGPGETVTWRSRQFGIPVRHTTEISGYDPPVFFQDRMMRGMFAKFVHDHFFTPLGENMCEMRDSLELHMPLFLGGVVTERLLVRRRMLKMLLRRNALIKETAEHSLSAGR